MNASISSNARAILLLTAPLVAGREQTACEVLKPSEYRRLSRLLRERDRQPADLLDSVGGDILEECRRLAGGDRLDALLGRGFLLSQVLERWQSRAIWVVSAADDEYPPRLRSRLGDNSPPVLYGCGEAALLDTGGLAVVGSRQADDVLVEFTESIGRLAAEAGRTIVSGGARGIDQAAMRGALEAGGRTAGVLADSLERAALNRENRELLMEGQLVLVSPYDPSAGFNVGHAMQRNKLIYALSDAALVVGSDYEKGGTWAGAVEQLEKLKLVPVYVRSNGESSRGLEALRRKGALPWPNPETPEALVEILDVSADGQTEVDGGKGLLFPIREKAGPPYSGAVSESPSSMAPADALFARVRELLEEMTVPKTEAEVAASLDVSKAQAKVWLKRLVDEGVLEKLSRPVRYRSSASQGALFDRRE